MKTTADARMSTPFGIEPSAMRLRGGMCAPHVMPARRTRACLLPVRLAGLFIMASLFLNLHGGAILAADGQWVPAAAISVKV